MLSLCDSRMHSSRLILCKILQTFILKNNNWWDHHSADMLFRRSVTHYQMLRHTYSAWDSQAFIASRVKKTTLAFKALYIKASTVSASCQVQRSILSELYWHYEKLQATMSDTIACRLYTIRNNQHLFYSPLVWREVRGFAGGRAPSIRKIFSIFGLQIATFGALWGLFLRFSGLFWTPTAAAWHYNVCDWCHCRFLNMHLRTTVKYNIG